MNVLDRMLVWAVRTRTGLPITMLPAPVGFGGNAIPPLSHGYVHEPFPGAWQMNKECFGPQGIFSAVYACIAIISGDVAKLPPKIRRRMPDGSKMDYDNHPAARVLWYPNTYQTHVDFWGQFMACSLYAGNAYVYLIRDMRGVITEMHILDPRRVRVLLAADGSVFYRVGLDPMAGLSETETYVPARNMLHHRLLALNHPLIGLTPLYAAGISAMTGQTIQQNSYAFFSNMSRPSGVLTAPGKIDEPLAQRLKAEWNDNFKAQQLGRTAVLGSGMKWEPMTVTAVDAQLIEQLKWSVDDVARCFRVPTYMLAEASKYMGGKNAEQLARNYYGQTLQYHLESIEARVDQAFDLADDVYCEFDLAGLLRMELDARFTAYSEAIRAGVLTINEARRLEELPPKEGGDTPLVQMQYQPLAMAGMQPRAPGAAAPPVDPNAPNPDDPNPDDTNPDDPAAADDTPEEFDMLAMQVRAWSLARLAA